MTQSIKREVSRDGFAFISDFFPNEQTADVANLVGRPMVPWESGLVQELTPRASSTPNTYSGIYGLGCFPFHTDLAHWLLPPRYLLLRCISGYVDVPTILIDGQCLMEAVTPDVLARAIYKPRRPRRGALPLLRLCEPADDGFRLRWDEVFLKPASKIGEVADQRVRAWLDRSAHKSITLERSGDTLLIDNWRMLHGRSAILPGREDRQIERVYLELLH